MKSEKDFRQLHQNGLRILVRLGKAIQEIRDLETLCSEHYDAILNCEQQLELVVVDIACISTCGGEWDEMSKLIREAGIEIQDDLDCDMRKLLKGDNSCLEQ